MLVVLASMPAGKVFSGPQRWHRESTLSWRQVLLKLQSRGTSTPRLAVGDGALGVRRPLTGSIQTPGISSPGAQDGNRAEHPAASCFKYNI